MENSGDYGWEDEPDITNIISTEQMKSSQMDAARSVTTKMNMTVIIGEMSLQLLQDFTVRR